MKHLLVAGAVALCACTVLYDPNNIDPRKPDAGTPDVAVPIDAAPDAPPDAMPDAPPDGPPQPLMIGGVVTGAVLEGTGTGGSRPALVILDVSGLYTTNPTITIADLDDGGTPVPVELVTSRVATDRSKIALALRVPVLTSIGEGATATARITIADDDEEVGVDLTVTGLHELAPATATVDTSTLRPRYARASFTSPVRFVGTAPALIRVTSDITIDAVVSVDGVNATPGAHGCPGGGQATAGSCGASGGGGGNSGLGGSAGGGGGFGAAGSPGMGNSPGAGGDPSGDAMLIRLTTNVGAAGNRGNGGGGGGGATLGGGGAGGGGGGVLELTADGAVTVTANGRARANGGNGTAGSGAGGGHGGGGSGGAIVIRAGGDLTAPAGWVSAAGGAGAGSSNKGGNGSIGRVRLDTTSDTAGMVTVPIPARGAMWRVSSPTITDQPMPAFEIVGAIGLTYGLVINNQAATTVMTGLDGIGAVSPTLQVGRNTLCVLASPAATLGDQESVRCLEVVYLP